MSGKNNVNNKNTGNNANDKKVNLKENELSDDMLEQVSGGTTLEECQEQHKRTSAAIDFFFTTLNTSESNQDVTQRKRCGKVDTAEKTTCQ